MPRVAREKSPNSIYHICVRGNNKQAIFLDDEDREEYLKRVRHYKERYKMQLYAYCLMTNHVHLLVYDNNQDISRFMQGLSLSYVQYFNRKYGRTGHLFQDRLTSVRMKNDMQLVYVSKYIHLNPVRANIVRKARVYKWSSYSAYEVGKDRYHIVDCAFLLAYFGNHLNEARFLYKEYINHNINEEMEEEMATTEEMGILINEEKTGLAVVSQKKIYRVLKKLWKQDIKKILYEREGQNRKKRMILIYLVGLLGRKNYREVAESMCISLGEVYQATREVVRLMISSHYFYDEINALIFLDWNKN